jgi:5-methyltetrahydropteroyltriglutamate--homocysteine methyltransferase
MAMPIPTEPIGSIPRPATLLEGMRDLASGRISQDAWRTLCDQAVRDTIERFEATGSPVITDEGADQAELRDLSDPGAHDPRTRRRRDPLR